MVRKGKKGIIGILLVLLTIVSVPHYFENSMEAKVNSRQYKEQNSSHNENMIYLSDIDYVKNKSKSGWNDFSFDKASDGTKLAIRYENAIWEFDKGVWAHATSTLVYDLEKYSKYTNFQAFVGLNRTAGGNSNGVYFTISVSNDMNTWTDKYTSKLKLGTDNADFVNIDISGYRYLRLYADMNGYNGSDHSVYADAKLTTKDYKEVDYDIKTVADYTKEIAKIQDKSFTNQEYEKLVLQRYLVSEFGEYGLKKFLSESEENRDTYKWLTEDVENLRMYIMGGKPDGSYYNSLTVLNKLLHAKLENGKNLIDDFKDTTPTKYGTTTMGNLYKKMAITLSLTHSTLVGLWMNPNVAENQSDAVTRYEIYKYLYNNNKFKVSERQDQTKWFEHLETEEMRFVMNNIIDDEEILWLNEYTQAKIDANPNKEEEWLQPHHYMKYIDPNYGKPEYYDPEKLPHWDELYGQFHSKYGITYKTGVQKLWMNIDNGAVCGGISKIGSNIRGVHGTPSSVINQPGHAALIYWRENDKGEGYWAIDNDVSNWSNSNKTEKLSVRMPLGWGDESYLQKTDVSEGVVNYVLLAQAALNNYDKYEKSREIYISADLATTPQEKINVYKKSLEALPINIDSWYGIIENYRELNKTDSEYLVIAQNIMEQLKYYPLPMYHLIEEILDDVTDVNVYYQIVRLRTETLESVTKLADTEHVQAYAIRIESNYLLNKIDSSLATFSFDGEDANKIVLTENYKNARWDYCLDGEACKPENKSQKNDKWIEVASGSSQELSTQNLQKITETNDIYVHLVGVNYSDTNLYKIDIQKPSALSLYANDLENRVIGVDEAMEWRIVKDEGKETPDSAWTSFVEASPNLAGNKTVQVRKRATSTYLMSDTVELQYKQDQQVETEKYVPTSYLTVDSFSTEAAGHDRYAVYAIDGNLNTHWHSDWNGNDKEKYIVLKLKRKMFITALEYVPRLGDSLNGRVIRAKIETSLDGKDWKEVYLTPENAKWSTDTSIKKATFNATEARYVKFTGVETHGNFITASMFNLYQDATIPTDPELEIAYSTLAPTNENVVARVVNLEENTIVDAICTNQEDDATCIHRETIENNMKESLEQEELTEEQEKMVDETMQMYVFKENGTIYFRFHTTDEPDKYYFEEATVTNIDTTAPNVSVRYTKESATNQDVIAILEADEPIKTQTGVPITYEEGENGERQLINIPEAEVSKYIAEHKTVAYIYTFEENGSYTFEYEDLAGNTGSVEANVSWIDKEAPFAAIHYSHKEQTSDNVTATLVPEQNEKIVVLNNNGDATYTFDENGSFEFVFQDEAGNISETTASVDWIVAKPQEENKNTEKTPNTQENTTTNSSVQTDSQDKQNTVYKNSVTNQNGNTTTEENVTSNSTTIEDNPEQTIEEKKENKESNVKAEEKSLETEEKKNSIIPILTIGTLSIASLTTCGIIIRKRR